MAGSVSTGFAQDNSAWAEKAGQTVTEYLTKGRDSLKSAVKATSGKASELSGIVAEKVGNAYGVASEKAGNAYGVISDGVACAYKAAGAQTHKAYAAASEKAVAAGTTISNAAYNTLNWAEKRTPEGVKAFIADHPHISIAAAITPVVLFIGYKILNMPVSKHGVHRLREDQKSNKEDRK